MSPSLGLPRCGYRWEHGGGRDEAWPGCCSARSPGMARQAGCAADDGDPYAVSNRGPFDVEEMQVTMRALGAKPEASP